MIKNFFTVAFRAVWKSKLFTAINISGLSIGISASLVIFLLVNHHFTFDKFEADRERIFRVVSNFNFSGEIYHNSGVVNPMGEAVRSKVTGLDQVVSFRTWNNDVKITVPGIDKKDPSVFKKQTTIVFADSNYFRLLQYTWISGSPGSSLDQPYQTVLTQSNAKLFFPGLDAAAVVGKTIYFNDTVAATITGVVKDLEPNTDFNFKTFIAYSTLEKTSLKPENWNDWGSTHSAQQLWVKLNPATPYQRAEEQIAKLYEQNYKREPGDRSKTWHTLQRLSDIHFNADYGTYGEAMAHRPTLYGLLAIACFLLMLGCINFINLTTANAASRSKEIGIRKTMGCPRRNLVLQFLAQTFLLTLVATIISIVVTPLLLKAFSGFMPAGLHLDLVEQPRLIGFLGLLAVLVTLLSGFYPAMVLSGYKPALILKNQAYANTGKTRHAWLRKSLTISQFVIAQVFIMGAIMVSKQITFSLTRDLGFRKEAILFMNTNYYDTVPGNKHLFRDKLRAIPGVSLVSLSSSTPSTDNIWTGTIKYKDGKQEIETDVMQKFGDSNYTRLYQLKLLAGNNLKQTDSVESFLINQTYANILGFKDPQQAIGKIFDWNGRTVPISGVVADFHQRSLHDPIKPLVIGSWAMMQRTVNIALQPREGAASASAFKATINEIEKAWKQVYPGEDFEYKFFDEDIAKFYQAEQNISSLLKWATGLSIFISCLGLLGLVIYTTTQRTKEIGVRKVLGASVTQIVTMVSKDFVLLVLLAFLVAAPIAGIGMHKWLQNFAYRTGMSWWIFGLGGCSMVVIALLTLAFQTIKAAMANPVKSLRTE